MTAPLPDLEPERPDLRVVQDDERAPTPEGMKARETDRGHPRTHHAPARIGVMDWFPPAMCVVVGGAGATGLLALVLPAAVCLALYAASIVAMVVLIARGEGTR